MITRLAQTLARLAALFRGRRLDDAVEEDLAIHLDLLTDDLIARGMTPDRARLEAHIRLGSRTSAMDAHRDARSVRWLNDARRDVGYAVRTLGRAPAFTGVASLTLALGIGGVTFMYSVIHHVLLAPFPYPAPERMVQLRVVTDRGGMRSNFAANEFLDYLEQSDVFESVAGVDERGAHLLAEGVTESIQTARGTPEMFGHIGVAPARGGDFGPPDARADAPPVAVLNHRAWTTLFGGDLTVVGRTVRIDGEPRTIIGIMPPRFEWQGAEIWIPAPAPSRTAGPGVGRARGFDFHARLRPGVTVENAEAQLTAIVSRRATLFPEDYRATKGTSRAQVRSLLDNTVSSFRSVLYTLFGAVAVLLIIACCNVANMLLARATAREREIAVRAALGAGRWRIVRQLLVESAVLAAGGVVLGCAFAYVGIELIKGWMPGLDVPAEAQLAVDVPVLVFALSTGLLATLVFGLYPALHGGRRDLLAGSTSVSRSSTANRRQHRLRNGLVVAEVVMALMLVVAAGLLTRSFLHRLDFNVGFDYRRIFVTQFDFPPGAPPTPTARRAFYTDLLSHLRGISGVQAAAVTSGFPVHGVRSTPLGLSRPVAGEPAALLQFCSEDYFATLGVRLISGRPLSASDVSASRKVAVVNETLAKRYFGGDNPLGQSMRLNRLATMKPPLADPVVEIVGVVQDFSNSGVNDPTDPEVYLPSSIPGYPAVYLLVRSNLAAERLVPLVREQVRAVNPNVALRQSGPLEGAGISSDWPVRDEHRFPLVVLMTFAITGLGLVGLGVYGVIAYNVSQQTREFAIRLALGGERRHVAAQVLRTTFWLVGTGTLIGTAGGLAAGRLVESQLYQTSARDPATLLAAVAVVLLTGVVACWVPARRAMRVNPATALRHDE